MSVTREEEVPPVGMENGTMKEAVTVSWLLGDYIIVFNVKYR